MNFDNLTDERFCIIKDLEVSERNIDNTKKYIIKNPRTNKFFILGQAQYKLLMAFDGTRTLKEIVEYMNSINLKISLEQVEKFTDKLKNMKVFIDREEEALMNKKKIEMQSGKTLFQRLLFIKIPIVNPDSFIKKLLSKVNFIFSPFFLSLMVLYIIFAISIYIFKFSPWKSSLISNSLSENIMIIVILYMITIFSSVFHEIAHALTCKKFGGKVSEMGFIIIYFRPGLFCNISDSYLFKEKKHRIYVSIAGIILDIIVWSTIILIGYLFKLNGSNLNFMPAFGFYGIITILLELNPLIKLDGYYALTEIIGIYNLRENSFNYLKSIFFKNNITAAVNKKHKRIYRRYSIFATVYSTWLIFYTLYILFKYLILKLNTPGMIIATIILIILFCDLIAKILLAMLKVFKSNWGNMGD